MKYLPKDGSLPTLEQFPDCNGVMMKVGTAVVATNKNGLGVEGNVVMLLPWGAEWFDPSWKNCTVVIKDHDSGERSNWNPANVEVLSGESTRLHDHVKAWLENRAKVSNREVQYAMDWVRRHAGADPTKEEIDKALCGYKEAKLQDLISDCIYFKEACEGLRTECWRASWSAAEQEDKNVPDALVAKHALAYVPTMLEKVKAELERLLDPARYADKK
jgi:hypothetical protein